MSDVWVKVKMPSELHGKFRLWSFENRCSMQGAILAWVEKVCSVDKTPTVSRKQAVVLPERSEAVKAEEYSIADKQCSVCNLMCRSWVYDKKGKPICPECAERLAGGNP